VHSDIFSNAINYFDSYYLIISRIVTILLQTAVAVGLGLRQFDLLSIVSVIFFSIYYSIIFRFQTYHVLIT